MNPDPTNPPPRSDARPLRHPLADRDTFCPQCGYNLRGLTEPRCPECGLAVRVPAEYADAGLSESDRLALWLRDHDLICRKCKTNLRGGSSNVCLTCGATYMLQHTSSIYVEPAAPDARTPNGAGVPSSWRKGGRRQTTPAAMLIVFVPLALLVLCIVVPLFFLLILKVLWR